METQCSCDGILARLIYGYTNYRRTMENLHPNGGSMAQLGGMVGGQAFGVNPQLGMPGGASVMPNLPFMSGNPL